MCPISCDSYDFQPFPLYTYHVPSRQSEAESGRASLLNVREDTAYGTWSCRKEWFFHVDGSSGLSDGVLGTCVVGDVVPNVRTFVRVMRSATSRCWKLRERCGQIEGMRMRATTSFEGVCGGNVGRKWMSRGCLD